MPSSTPKQKRMMAALAHGAKLSGAPGKIPRAVAEEFNQADAAADGKKHKSSKGPIGNLGKYAHPPRGKK